MTNPAEEFLKEKRAFGFGDAAKGALSAGKSFAGVAGTAAAMGMGAAAFAGVTVAASKLYSSATKSRDFRKLLEANPDLRAHQKEDPVGFNRMYTSLRTLAPEFAAEPLVAGHFMRQGMENPLEGRGATTLLAAGARKPRQMGPAVEAALEGYMKGMPTRQMRLDNQATRRERFGANGASEGYEETRPL